MKPLGIYLVLLFALVSCGNAKTNEDDNDTNKSVCSASFSLGLSGEIFVPAQIDSCSFTLFFDTGAGGLMISDSVAKVLNIPDSLCHRSHFYTPRMLHTDSPDQSSVFSGGVTVMLGDVPVSFDSVVIVRDFHFVFQTHSNAIMSIPCSDERVWMINNDKYRISVSDSLDTQDYEYTYDMVIDRQLFVTDLCLSLSNSSDTINITNDFLIDTGSNIDISVLGI